jgi:hypothetical protein
MVRTLARRLPLLALAGLLGAVGIGPREGDSGRGDRGDRGDRGAESPRTAAPSPAPSPAAAASQPRVHISPRVTAPVVRRPEATAPSAGFSPSPAGRAARVAPAQSPSSTFTRSRPAAAPITRFSPATTGPVRIQRREGVENVQGRHYWHESGGRRYSHFYDGRVHWYGYPFGASFFWMRPFGGFWWTWDARFSRWCYWYDGFWWWPGPGGTQFVYTNDNYYPYDTVRQGAYTAPPSPPADTSGSWMSPDGTRLVEIAGPDAEAILYDKRPATPAYIRFLGKDVQKVRFSSGSPGSPPTILVEFRDGSFAVFDYDGRRLDNAKPAEVKEAPPPADVPPPPPAGAVPPAPPDELPPPP